jgi:hypothetical protein
VDRGTGVGAVVEVEVLEDDDNEEDAPLAVIASFIKEMHCCSAFKTAVRSRGVDKRSNKNVSASSFLEPPALLFEFEFEFKLSADEALLV